MRREERDVQIYHLMDYTEVESWAEAETEAGDEVEGRCTALTVQRTLPPSTFLKTKHKSDTGGGVGGEEI